MSCLNFKYGLLLSLALATPPGLAHGPMHQPDGLASGSAASPDVENFYPTYLLAAVCSMHDHGGEAFERRLQLVQFARAQRQPSDTAAGDQGPPLYDNLGDHSYPVTTDSALAQRYFDQGLRLAYAFNHFEAWRAFKKAQALDPECAMCYWGEAWVLGPNINAPMEPAAVPPAVEAIERAKAYADYATGHERALIDALAERYSADPEADRVVLNQAFTDAMAEVVARYPGDVDIASIYADALMNTSPWDYWESDGRTLKPAVADLTETLERALAEAPNHPYAMHLYIHAFEASNAPERAEPYADRLGEQVPGAGHLVHMPFHIYFRIGRFQDAIAVNRDAITADEAYLAQAPAREIYTYGYYPHNVHSLLESARMAGDGKTAIAAARRLPRIMSDKVAAAVPWVQVMKAAPYFAHAQFSAPATTLGLSDPGERFPYVKAMWHYARGVAQAARGDAEAAQREVEAIAVLEETADFSGLLAGGVPAPNLLSLARHVVNGRIAQARSDYDQAVESFGHAVAIQDGLPYLEPPYWYYPVRQSLGAALLQAGRARDAERVFSASLEDVPNNGWALYGLLQAHQAQGNAAAAAETRKRLDSAWIGDKAKLDLARL